MSHKYLTAAAATTGNPLQSMPLNARQVENSAGGFVFAVNDWTRLDRWLILGSESNTYYATEKQLTLDNIDALKRVVAEDGLRAVKRIVEISEAGRRAGRLSYLKEERPQGHSDSQTLSALKVSRAEVNRLPLIMGRSWVQIPPLVGSCRKRSSAVRAPKPD